MLIRKRPNDFKEEEGAIFFSEKKMLSPDFIEKN